MVQYNVSFYKDLLSPYGIPFRCLQAEIRVEALTFDEAAVTAEREFERCRQIPDWKICADDFEVESEPRAQPLSDVSAPSRLDTVGAIVLLSRAMTSRPFSRGTVARGG